VLLNVTYGTVSHDEINNIEETNIVKFMKLSQMIIEYLLYSQDVYKSYYATMDSKLKEIHQKVFLFSIINVVFGIRK